MPGTVKQETYQPIQFDAIQIGLASPEKSESGPEEKLRNLRPLTIEL